MRQKQNSILAVLTVDATIGHNDRQVRPSSMVLELYGQTIYDCSIHSSRGPDRYLGSALTMAFLGLIASSYTNKPVKAVIPQSENCLCSCEQPAEPVLGGPSRHTLVTLKGTTVPSPGSVPEHTPSSPSWVRLAPAHAAIHITWSLLPLSRPRAPTLYTAPVPCSPSNRIPIPRSSLLPHPQGPP